jgi:hypothetical protein
VDVACLSTLARPHHSGVCNCNAILEVVVRVSMDKVRKFPLSHSPYSRPQFKDKAPSLKSSFKF